MNKKTALFIIIFIIIGAGVGLVSDGDRIEVDVENDFVSCLELQSGTVGVQSKYGDYFISRSGQHTIRIFKHQKKVDENFSVLMLSVSEYPSTVESIIEISKAERPGPLYDEKVDFKGHASAYAQITDNQGTFEYYKVPVGNRVLNFSLYSTTTWSQQERHEAEALINNVKILTDLENSKDISVRPCE